MEKTALRLLVATAICASLPSAAGAQVASELYRPASKTEAILGAPSALDLIRMQQGGTRVASIAPSSAARPSFGAQPMRAPMVRAVVSNERPDIFNSVALNIGRSPLDARFRAASAMPAGGAAAFATSLRSQDTITRIEAVNAYVNSRVRFVDDSVQFGVADRWMSASETLGRGRGDCEDYALAKRALLRAAGFADKDLYLVVLKDLTRRADHAVLVVRANGRFLVLDNGTNRIVDSEDVRDYRPIFTFVAGKVWTHGYRREVAQPTVEYASLRTPAKSVLADALPTPASGSDGDDVLVLETASLMPTTITL